MLRSRPLAAWCAADPGPIVPLALLRVAALRRTAEAALRRVRDTKGALAAVR